MKPYSAKTLTNGNLPLFLSKKSQCSGCGSCIASCPTKAIFMSQDIEGFLYPEINKSKCINCHLCEQNCPAIHSKQQNPYTDHFCYAVQASDETRKYSSSGGVFTLLAQYVLQKGGYVCGAAFAEDWSVHHILINKEVDLSKLRGSKYVQSNMEGILPLIKKHLENNKMVLFTGTPCQIAGLLSYLPAKYPNLFTVDCICHGVPNNQTWQKYLKDNLAQQQIIDIQFRNKSIFGWSASGISFKFKDGFIKKHTSYFEGFNYNLYLRPSCSNCRYASFSRISDLTLGDFWGIDDIDPLINDKKGTSLLLIHSAQGMSIFKEIQPKLKLYRQYPKTVLAHSPNYPLYKSLPAHRGRELFFRNFHLTHFNSLIRQILYEKYDIGLVGPYTVKNYGNNLQYYCLYHAIKQAGFSVLMIERPADAPVAPDLSLQPLFRKNPYDPTDQSRILQNQQEMKQLNGKVRSFLVGSDQLFRQILYEVFGKYVSLDWVNPLKCTAVYGLSFGVDFCEYSSAQCKKLGKKLKKFSMLSFREKSALRLMNAKFCKVTGPWVLDPVFLVDRQLLESLSKQGELTACKHNLFCYILDQTMEKSEVIKSLAAQKSMIPIILTDAAKEKNSPVKVEDWLRLLTASGLIITDSFHAMCLALIFEKEFFIIINQERGATRFTDLLTELGLLDRIITDPQNLLKSYPAINWEEVNVKLNQYRQDSKDWLYRYLDKTKEPISIPISIELKRKLKYIMYYFLFCIVPNKMKVKIEKKVNKYRKESFYAGHIW